jgi:hypothetical protein
VAPAIPLAKNGVVDHPIFGQGNGWSHPHGQSRGGQTTPLAQKKKEERKMSFGLLGVVEPPPRAWGHPHALGGGPATPKSPKPIFHFFDLLGVIRPPLGQTTPRSAVGVAPTTHWPKMGWPDHPILAKGVAGQPQFYYYYSSSF